MSIPFHAVIFSERQFAIAIAFDMFRGVRRLLEGRPCPAYCHVCQVSTISIATSKLSVSGRMRISIFSARGLKGPGVCRSVNRLVPDRYEACGPCMSRHAAGDERSSETIRIAEC
ncbi:hypothetical protein BGLA2_150017 [Burkholderia gladioli]|nr:hypothetical protein BGLA2_150017 [Burkholderia gladioli]